MTPTDLYYRVTRHWLYEQVQPYMAAACGFAVSYFAALELPSNKVTSNTLLSSSITASSIMFGFMTTSLVLLLSLEGHRKHAFDRSSFTKDFIRYICEAIYLALSFTAYNLVGFFVGHNSVLFMAFWVAMAIALVFAFHRIFGTLIWLLKGS